MSNLIVSNMTQEQKDLLLKDLCARLPYGIKGNYQNSDDKLLRSITIVYNYLKPNGMVMTGDIKPYLFPLSNMTKEQCYEFYCRFVENEIDYDDFKEYYFDNGLWHKLLTSIDDCNSVVDWFNKNNIDYRGLIPMGLAIDATNLGIYE